MVTSLRGNSTQICTIPNTDVLHPQHEHTTSPRQTCTISKTNVHHPQHGCAPSPTWVCSIPATDVHHPQHKADCPDSSKTCLVSNGSFFSLCSMNSARLSSVVTISAGMEGEARAASRDRTKASLMGSSSSAQQDTKPAANSSLAMLG